LVGYKDANGAYHDTALTRALRYGGVICLDEVDRGNPNTLCILNAASSTNPMTLGSGETIIPHADCRLVATANTWGTGPNTEYVGANRLDAATINRYVRVLIPYDEDHERAICDRAHPQADKWIDLVQSWRRIAERQGIKAVISPRQSIYGCKALRSGIDFQDLPALFLHPGLSQDSISSIEMSLP
jgi:MoxR-like ATPase